MAKTRISITDINDLETLMEQATIIKQHALENNTISAYPLSFKKETVRIRFVLEVNNETMDRELGLEQGLSEEWSTKHSLSNMHAIGQQHGNTFRYDVPTKAHVVKMHIEDGIPIHTLAENYNVSQSTISAWKNKYKNNYKIFMYGLEGTLVVGREDKRATGLANIKRMQLIAQHSAEISKKALIATQSLNHDLEPVYAALQTIEEVNNSLSFVNREENHVTA